MNAIKNPKTGSRPSAKMNATQNPKSKIQNSHRQMMALFTRAGFSEDQRRDLIRGYTGERTASTRELTNGEIAEICGFLSKNLSQANEAGEMDRLRKRLIAAIGGWLRKLRYEHDIYYIKKVAEVAAGTAFNKIPKQRLISLYSAFLKKQKDLNFAENLTAEHILRLASQN